MSYVRSVLQPNERILVIGKLHWIVFVPAIFLFVLGGVLLALEYGGLEDTGVRLGLVAFTVALFFGVGLYALVRAWFIRSITEFAVTDRRVVYKRGFIARHTAEMNMDKIESVDVDQSVLGRLLGYGTIHVLGTGQGIEVLEQIAAPIKIRNAITAK
jgi:uncharacterized membrane protein YdbT with pleckstrin-like domain